MSNPKEGYAFITNSGWSEHLSSDYPKAIPIGIGYRMIQFDLRDKSVMESKAKSLGYDVKYLNAEETINEMTGNSEGPFMTYADEVHQVVYHFNPPESS